MTGASKEAIEEKHVGILLSRLGLQCATERGAAPAPDFLFKHEGRMIGLEHTRLFAKQGSAQLTTQARENLIDRISNAARKEYEKRRLPPVEVVMHINQCHYIKKARIKGLAAQIVDVVRENLPDNPGSFVLYQVGDGCLPEEIDYIRMIRFPEQTSVSFFASRSAWIPTIDLAHLQSTIDRKATHLQDYLDACDEAWLLMVEDRSNLSTTLEMPPELWKHTYNFQGFARLFVLREGEERRFYELQGDNAALPDQQFFTFLPGRSYLKPTSSTQPD